MSKLPPRGLLAATLAICLLSANAFAQDVRSPAQEFGLSAPSLDRTYIAARPNVDKFIAEDGKAQGTAYRYGVVVDIDNLSFTKGRASAGELSQLPDGRALWRVQVMSPGAKSLDFGFDMLRLPKGAEMFISSADGKTVRGPITASEVQADGRFFSAYVPGDTAIVEIAVPAKSLAALEARVGAVTHAYRGLFDADPAAKSGSCNVDTICPLGNTARDQIDSVGHYTFQQGSSSYVCTGALIANAQRNTTPYFLTANHCASTEAVADTIVVYWNYQSATCRTPGSSASGSSLNRSIATHNQSGSALVATNAASDFTLLRLDAAVPTAANPYWSGWDNRDVVPTSAIGIHHPAGHEKRISSTAQALARSSYSGAAGSGTTHWRIPDWDNGTTEGGSSGSGLWNQDRRLIGQLHGGSAACGNNLEDYYGRIATSWTGGGSAATRLRDWLDPSSTGATTLDGNRAGTGGNTAPTASFSFSTSGLTANFTDASTDAGGSITARNWNFGDSTTSTAANPSKTYAAAGTYTVSLTVTDNGGLTNSTTRSVTVTAPGGGATALSNGVGVSGSTNSASANSSWADYTVVIPAGATNLNIATTVSTGDLDLHVKFGAQATTTVYDCRPYGSTGNESCPFATPSAGTYFARVYGYATGLRTFTITATWTAGGGGGGIVERLSNGNFDSITSSTNTAPDGSWARSASTGTSFNTLLAGQSNAQSGGSYAYLGVNAATSTHTVDSKATLIPSGGTMATLSFSTSIVTSETSATSAYDRLQVQLVDAGTNAVLTTLVTLSNVNKTTSASTYVLRSYNVAAYKGRNVKVRFIGSTDGSLATTFRVDGVSLKSD